VFRSEWFPKQWILQQVNLSDREIVRGTPVGVDGATFTLIEGAIDAGVGLSLPRLHSSTLREGA